MRMSASAPCSPSSGWSQLADGLPDDIAESAAGGGRPPGLPRPGEVPAALARRFLIEFDTDSCVTHECDVLVVGSGIAGLTAALAASKTRRVALVTKGRLTETNTWYAQGGIAGAVGEADSVELHLADTLVVGQGLCDEAVVRAVVGEAPEALAGLRDYGVHFDLAEGGEVALAREGGHSLPRVLHSGDATGAAIQRALTDALRASERVAVFEQRFLVDLLTERRPVRRRARDRLGDGHSRGLLGGRGRACDGRRRSGIPRHHQPRHRYRRRARGRMEGGGTRR